MDDAQPIARARLWEICRAIAAGERPPEVARLGYDSGVLVDGTPVRLTLDGQGWVYRGWSEIGRELDLHAGRRPDDADPVGATLAAYGANGTVPKLGTDCRYCGLPLTDGRCMECV